MSERNVWPELPLEEWKDTYATLHMWTQIVGKIKLLLTPPVNHWWNSTLYVTPTGLTTGSMFYKDQLLQIDFNFISHLLLIITTDNPAKSITLRPRSVAEFYQEIMDALKSLGMPVTIWTTPVEVQDQTPFEKDHKHVSYDPKYVRRLWFILSQATRVLSEFRSRYVGKVSPVHFFWGAFDLAVTRFSGRPAPQHAGVPNCPRHVMVEAYSHEVSSCGFWPGGGPVSEPVFYAYAYPEPQGFKNYPVRPTEAYYYTGMSEFLLPYEKVRIAESPDDVLLSFLQSTYEAEATLAEWDRNALERH
jgi:uncharacterized protein DUF5996